MKKRAHCIGNSESDPWQCTTNHKPRRLTNTRNTSVEVIERTYPLKVHRYGLIPDSAGVGRHRGGCGIVREIECLGPRTQVTVGADRRKFTPWGVEGGQAARGAHCRVTSRDGSSRELPTKFFTALQEGDRLHIEPPGGGGWGPPEDRAAEAVQQDVIAAALNCWSVATGTTHALRSPRCSRLCNAAA